MAKKKQLKIDINSALKGKTYDLKNISDIYITYDSNLGDCLDMSVSGSTLTMKVSGNVVVYKFTNISDSMPIKVYHSNGTEKFNGTLQEFYSNLDSTPVEYSYTIKKNVITGTALTDVIDVHNENYKGKGFTINAGAGDDEVTGTLFADTISGGVGNNIINYAKGDGNDIINLTNKENLLINMSSDEGVYSIDDLRFAYANKNKDLRIYTDKDSNAEFITLKNFAKKDVTGTGSVFVKIGGKTYNIETSQNVSDPKNPVDVVLYSTTLTGKGSNVTGTWLNEVIDASAVEGRTQQVKNQVVDASTNKGLTLNGGAGNDTITGSKYSDTINGGAGDDIIYASNGNDAITGGAGRNQIIYSTTPFGKDTITLTKNETLTITGLVLKEGKTLGTSCSKSGNNLLIYTEHGQVVLKNYYTKNTGASVIIDINGVKTDLAETPLLPEVNAANYFEVAGKKMNAKYTGTALADVVDASGLSKQTAKNGVGVTINSGLGNDEITGSNFKDTINTGAGDDVIYGSEGADSITGGAGRNTINYTSLDQLSGDKITLTKNETLNINVNVAGATATYKVNGKNLDVTITKDEVSKTFTILNFGTKDVTTSNGAVNLSLNGEDAVDLRTALLTKLEVSKNYTGTWHADNISAENYIVKNKDGSENLNNTKGLTLNGGAGNDNIVGSKYKDTIKGGADNDTIEGGRGNDNLYGEGGENTFIFNKGDNDDIVYNGKGSDTLKFENATDLTFEQVKQDLVIRYNYADDVAQDSVTIKGYYDKKNNIVSSVKHITILGKTFGVEELRTLMSDPNFKIVVNADYEVPEEHKEDNQVIIVDNEDEENPINIITKDGDDTIYGSENGVSNIDAGNGDNTIYGGNGGTITTGTGDDEIHGGTNNVIESGSGDDTIYTGNAESVNGGAGDDIIHLEQDSNEIHIGDNNGNDTIIFDEKQEEGNTIVFDDKTLSEVEDETTGVTFAKDGNDLVINTGGENTVTLDDYLNQNNENISETIIEGNDGESTTLTEIINDKGIDIEGVGNIQGTQYKDNITGSDSNDTISAGVGNDNVNAGAGHDTIYGNAQGVTGGVGSNVIDGGAGNDTIHLQEAHNEVHFNGNYGNDTLVYDEHQENGNTIVFDDKTLEQIEDENTGIQITKDGDDIIVDFKDGSNNSVKIQDYLNAQAQEKLSETVIKGSDGANSTTLAEIINEKGINIEGAGEFSGTQYKDNITGSDEIDIVNAGAGNDTIDAGAGADTISGGAGNDIINANEGNDILIGGTDNDTLSGGEGEDKFYFSSGDGKDVVTDATNADALVFAGVDEITITMTQKSTKMTSLFVGYGDNGDEIEIENYFVKTPNPDYPATSDQEYIYPVAENAINKFGVVASVMNDNHVVNVPEEYYTLAMQEPIIPDVPQSILNYVIGDDNDNILNGSNIPNQIEGRGGNDTITGGSSADKIYGGTGNDVINGGLGNNSIYYAVGDGDDTILNGGGTDTLTFAEGTKVVATYGTTQETKNDLIITYSAEDGTNSGTITLKDYKDGHSVQQIKVGETVSDVTDLISIGTTEYYTRDMGIWPILQRGVYGTDSAETLAGTPTGYYATGYVNGESYYTYGGNDNIVLRRTSDNDRLLDNFAAFKVGDGNDTVKNSEWVKDGAALYSEEQAIYQEKVYTYSHGSDVSDTHGSTGLNFKGVHLNAITAEKDGDDIVITYATANTTDTVRIKNGYYSTNVDGITAYDIDSSVYQVTQPMYYADVLPNSEEWESHRQTQQTTDYGYGYGVNEDGSLINGTKWYETTTLRDLVHDINIADGEEETLSGWIWSDSISASNDKGHTINGYGGSDTLTGGALADTIYGGEGHDTINGSDGNDVLYGFRVEDPEEHVNSYISDNDTINGGAGNDTIYGGYGYDTINGGAGEDEIHGSVYYSTIHGDADNDNIEGVGELYGDGGNDTITGKGKLYGGAGDDTITLQANQYGPYIEDAEGNEVYPYADGGDGNDTINLSLNNATRNAVVLGGAGDDEIGSTRYYDNELGRWVFPSYTRDVNIDAGSGNDHIVIRSEQRTQNVTIQGGSGDDTIEYQYSFRADSIGTGIDNTDVSIIKDSSGNDTLALIGTNNMSYHGNGATPVAFFDMTIDNNGNITSLGEDNSLYVATTFAGSTNSHNLRAYGDKTKSLKLESVLSQNGNILSSSIENIYIRGEWMSDECGYYKLDVENLAKAYANYLKTTTYRTLQDALTNGTAQIKEALAQIAMGNWTHTMYRPVLESDDQAVYGDDTDQTLDANKGYVIGGSGNETINGTEYDDYLDGGAGADTIHSGDGNDIIIGGVGNDTLSGGDGADKFYFSVGDGNDVITDATSTDTIVLVGVTDFSDITLTQKETNKTSLFINYGDTDTIEIQNYFVQTQHPEYKAPEDPGYIPEYHSLIPQYIYTKAEGAISQIGFVPSVLNDNQILNTPDETYNFAYTEPDYYTDPTAIVYNYDTPQNIYSEKTGDAGNNNLVGDNNKLNVIKGLAGNDTITGGNQADVIYGGTGNDTINAGAGQNFIHYALGDGNDTIVSGGGEDTLVFAEGTNVIAAYGTGEHANDLILTYSGNGQSNTITLTNYKTTEHSVKHVQVGNVIQNPSDLIAIGTTEFFNYYGDVWPILQRGVYGTDSSETLAGTPTGIYANSQGEGESYYTYSGNDKVVLRLTSNIGELANGVYFKPGDDNDTIVNAQRIKEGAAEYSEEQAIYQEDTWAKPNQSSTGLNFRGVTIDDLDVQVVGNDIVINFTDSDSVTIKDGYYSTNVRNISTYDLDPNYQQARTRLWYGDGEPGSAEWIATREVVETTDYGYGNQGTSYYDTVRLRDLISDKNIDNSDAETAQTAEGWIWKDAITASDHGDTIKGYSGNDILIGGAGNDTIDGGGDNDTITGGAGVDTIYGGDGKDNIDGGEGDDIINGFRELRPGEVAYNLAEYADDDDIINGGAGDDTIYGGFGRDIINGATGNDTIVGANYELYNGNNLYLYSTINGGGDNDTITGSGVIHGDDGNDTISGNGKLYGDNGDDTITLIETGVDMQYYTEMTNPYIDGGEGNDTIIFSHNGNDFDTTPSITVLGGAGDDYIKRGTSANLDNLNIDAGSGNDHVYINNVYSTKNNTIEGGAGNDTIEFKSSLFANSSNDISVVKDSSGTDDKLLILGDNMGYYDRYDAGTVYNSCPVAFFDMTIDGDGNVLTLGDDIYINSTYSNYLSQYSLNAYGNKTKSLKIEGALSSGDTFENIYIKNTEEGFNYVNDTNIKHGYRKLNLETLKTNYINYMKANGLTDLSAAIGNATHKAALAQIAMSDEVWEYTLYRPTYEDETGAIKSIYQSDNEGVYGNSTDQILKSRFNPYEANKRIMNNEYIVGGRGNETIYSMSGGNDLIYGGAGDDFIYAGRGNDEIHAGAGDDTIAFYNDYRLKYQSGYYSNMSDTLTDGNDVVYTDEGGVDTLDFGQSIAVKFQKSNNDLKVYYNFDDSGNGKSSVTVKDFYVGNALNNNCSVKKIKLLGQDVADLTAEYIASNEYTTDANKLITQHDNKVVYFGTENADEITIKYKNNFVYGGLGADTIATANEFITGENYLDGGAGDDTYNVGVTTKTTIYDSGNDGTVKINTTKTGTKGFYDMSVTVKDGVIVDYDYKALRLYQGDGIDDSLNILANPNLAGTQDNNVAKSVTEIQTTEEIGYQKITSGSITTIAQQTASWLSTYGAGMADGTYSTADIVSAGGADANTLIGYVENAWQLGQS